MTIVREDRGLGAARLHALTTLHEMQKHVRASLTDPMVWETARNIVVQVGPRDEVNQARAIRAWLADRFRFINDPIDVQNLTTPRYMLEKIGHVGFVQGNCADAAMLAAALCMAIRIPCSFIAVAFHTPTAPYQHVFTMAYPRDMHGAKEAIEFDVTRPPDVRTVRFTRRLILPV